MLRFDSTGRSDVGLVRDHNEDSGFAGPTLQLVADGVGGAAAGEVASATTAYVVTALALAEPHSDVLDLLRRATDLVQEQLRAGIARDRSRAGMATTLTALITDGERVALAHVGDSRAYLLRDGALHQLTRDDTFVQMLVDQGLLSPEEARHHPRKNVVVRALDGSPSVRGDAELADVRAGDRLLVCSDGLSDLVDDEGLARCLLLEDRDEAADALVAAALEAGGVDNVTCLVADVVDGARLQPDGLRLGAFADPTLVVDPAAVRAVTP
jgi:protein phosphatase